MMKYYSKENFAQRAARNAASKLDRDIWVTECNGLHTPNPKYERGAAKRGGNFYGQIILDHPKDEILKTEISKLKGFEIVFDPQGTDEERAKRREQSQEGYKEMSTVSNPVQKVWDICNENMELKRKEIIEICVEAGIAKNTAATQYAKWKKDLRENGLDGEDIDTDTDEEITDENESLDTDVDPTEEEVETEEKEIVNAG